MKTLYQFLSKLPDLTEHQKNNPSVFIKVLHAHLKERKELAEQEHYLTGVNNVLDKKIVKYLAMLESDDPAAIQIIAKFFAMLASIYIKSELLYYFNNGSYSSPEAEEMLRRNKSIVAEQLMNMIDQSLVSIESVIDSLGKGKNNILIWFTEELYKRYNSEPKKYEQVYIYFCEKAAVLNHPQSLYNLARYYNEGKHGVHQDEDHAARLIIKLMDKKDQKYYEAAFNYLRDHRELEEIVRDLNRLQIGKHRPQGDSPFNDHIYRRR